MPVALPILLFISTIRLNLCFKRPPECSQNYSQLVLPTKGKINSFAWGSDSDILYASTTDKQFLHFKSNEAGDFKLYQRISGLKEGVKNLLYSQTGYVIIQVGDSEVIFLEENSLNKALSLHLNDALHSLALMDKGEILALSTATSLMLYNISGRKYVWSEEFDEKEVTTLAYYMPSGLLAHSQGGLITFYDSKMLRLFTISFDEFSNNVEGMIFINEVINEGRIREASKETEAITKNASASNTSFDSTISSAKDSSSPNNQTNNKYETLALIAGSSTSDKLAIVNISTRNPIRMQIENAIGIFPSNGIKWIKSSGLIMASLGNSVFTSWKLPDLSPAITLEGFPLNREPSGEILLAPDGTLILPTKDGMYFYSLPSASNLTKCYGLDQELVGKCKEGHYPSGGTCKACKRGCKTCEINSQLCTGCNPGKYLHQGLCLDNCPKDYSFDEQGICMCLGRFSRGGCVKCPTECAECDQKITKCLSCTIGFRLTPLGICIPISEPCPVSEFLDEETTVCKKCLVNCRICNNSSSCGLCDDRYELINGNTCKFREEEDKRIIVEVITPFLILLLVLSAIFWYFYKRRRIRRSTRKEGVSE